MISEFKVDQANTFTSVHLMSVEPKTAFKSDEQESNKDGTPKWQAKVAVTYQVFGRNESEILNVNLASRNDPGEGVPPFSPVQMQGLTVTVREKKDGADDKEPEKEKARPARKKAAAREE